MMRPGKFEALAVLIAGALFAVLGAGPAFAQTPQPEAAASRGKASLSPNSVEAVVVTGRRRGVVGEAISASEGSVGRVELESRPLLRSGDLLEFVPGLVATQHSGSGKANQYFLRGFNLDHGTDFATSVDAMPVNMRTHGHGQGWTDLNFLIPEAVEELTYRKGTYYADVGDFSSTGSARFRLADSVGRGLIEATVGDFGYARGVLVNSAPLGPGDLLYAAELQTYDGPWTDIDEDVRKVSGMVRYSFEAGPGRAHVTVLGYDNRWNSHDQVPQRAVNAGRITPFGSIDATVGGESSRYSLSGGWRGTVAGGRFAGEAYAISSQLDLFSNFTYLLDDPVGGDQFEQVDERRLFGFELSQQWDLGRSRVRLGADGRYDDISRVGLFRTQARERLSTVREDAVKEASLGLFAAHEFRFNDRLRTYLGLRYDRFEFDVSALSLPENSGKTSDGTASFKASVVYRPADPVEFYLSYGQGFHSNDARGTVIRTDPVTGDPADPVDPLVDSDGAELGARLFLSDRLQATAALWTLRLDSELLFVGDAGNTEASRPSKREGVEFGLYYFAGETFSAELEASYTRSRFRDSDPLGDEIPGAIPLVVSGGLSAKTASGYLAAVRVRYFSPYALIEDGEVESDGSTLINLRVGKTWDRLGLHLDVLNALDSADHDIDYFYPSRLPGESEGGVEDIHFAALPSRSLRLSLRYEF